MILGAISTAELAMYDVGIKFELGSGVAAAIKHLKGIVWKFVFMALEL